MDVYDPMETVLFRSDCCPLDDGPANDSHHAVPCFVVVRPLLVFWSTVEVFDVELVAIKFFTQFSIVQFRNYLVDLLFSSEPQRRAPTGT